MDTTGACAVCPPIDFDSIQMTFPNSLKQEFMKAMASGMPNSPEFCATAEANICANYETNACCCEPEMAEWQNCIVQRDLAVSVGQQQPCNGKCALESAGGGGGGGNMMIIIIMVVLILIGGGGGGFFFYRRRQANSSGRSKSKSKGKSKKKISSDDSLDDSFRDEKIEKPKKKGFFAIFSKGNETVTGSDTDSQDSYKKKRDGLKSPKGKNKKRRDYDDLVGEDIEGGMISDVSSSRDDRARKSNRKKRYEDAEDSISDAYGGSSYKKHGNRSPPSHYGSRNSYDDEISDLENRDLEIRRDRSYGNGLPDRISNTKKISSRELKKLMRDKEESDRRMSFMQEEMKTVEDRLARKDREFSDLRRDRDEQERRIQELEALNARLQQESKHARGRGGRSSGGSNGSDDHYRDNYGNNGYNSRSKASISEEEESYGRDGRNNRDRSRQNPSKSLGRSNHGSSREQGRSGSSRELGRSNHGSNREMGRSGSNRDMRRSNSGRSLNRDGSRRNNMSRSPSSTRGLGKQASSMRREQSREKLDRSGHRKTSRSKNSHRSKSPRSYLRNDEP